MWVGFDFLKNTPTLAKPYYASVYVQQQKRRSRNLAMNQSCLFQTRHTRMCLWSKDVKIPRIQLLDFEKNPAALISRVVMTGLMDKKFISRLVQLDKVTRNLDGTLYQETLYVNASKNGILAFVELVRLAKLENFEYAPEILNIIFQFNMIGLSRVFFEIILFTLTKGCFGNGWCAEILGVIKKQSDFNCIKIEMLEKLKPSCDLSDFAFYKTFKSQKGKQWREKTQMVVWNAKVNKKTLYLGKK